MRVALMTTWSDTCGIATYSEALAPALTAAGAEVDVLAATPLLPRHEADGDGVTRLTDTGGILRVWPDAWERAFPEGVERALEQAGDIELLHIQHEHGLFLETADGVTLRATDQACLGVIDAAQARGIKVVLTLHTVTPYSRLGRAGFYDALAARGVVLIVHTVQARAAVACSGARVYRVPHGTSLVQPGDPSLGRDLLEVGAADRVVLVWGFVSKPKNIEGTIRSWAAAYPDLPRPAGGGQWVLVVRGLPPRHSRHHLELEEVAAFLGRPVKLQLTYSSTDDLRHVMAAAEFGVLSNDNWNLSASGQVHAAAAAQLPLAVADRPIYAEAIAAGAVPFQVPEAPDCYRANESLVNAMVGLARCERLRRGVAADLYELAIDTAWANVAQAHVDIYGEVLSC